jgi:hypothetical protein
MTFADIAMVAIKKKAIQLNLSSSNLTSPFLRLVKGSISKVLFFIS